MGQISMEKSGLAGSALSGNQHFTILRSGRLCACRYKRPHLAVRNVASLLGDDLRRHAASYRGKAS
jgi:hypothetical protein